MSNQTKVYVASVGMITPVGANAQMTAAAVKAGVSRYEESEYYNKELKRMKMALVPNDALPPLKENLSKVEKLSSRQVQMLRLAAPALQEVLAKVKLKESVPLFLAGPETFTDCPKAMSDKFIDYLIAQSGANIDPKLSRVLATGRAGGIQAIDLAFKYINSGKDVALVGGVDSYQDLYLLDKLDNEDRILADSVMDGFAPAEAAGFLLLVSERVINKLPAKPLAVIYPPGISQEKGHRYSEEPYRGDGLAEACASAIESGNQQPVKAIYASLNGESLGAKELGVAIMRNKANFIEDYKMEHPADCFGDVGAAFGPISVGLMSMDKPGTYLGYSSSDTQTRAAIITQVI